MHQILSSENKSAQKFLNRFTLANKGANRLLWLGFFGIFFVSISIHAQIYDEQNDQVAGINALMSAVANNDVEGVKFFSKAGRVLVNQKNLGGATVLHIACREKNFEIAKVLVENGADVNVTDNEGWTPLMRASLAGDVNIVNLLLSKNAQANNLNSIGESALIHAASSDCSDCLDAMFEKFNFIKLMEIKLLKEQLTDAFVIARNRDNQRSQNLIEAYLDKAVKMAPLMEKEAEKAETENSTTTRIAGGKIFKIISPDSAETPMLAKKTDERTLVQTPTATAPTTNSLKKFKFISGPQFISKAERKELQKKQNYKFSSEQSDSEKSLQPKLLSKIFSFSGAKNTAEKSAEIAEKSDDKEVILLIEKSPNAKPDLVTKSGNSVFKFHKGEDGKILKRKVKVKKPAVVKEVVKTPEEPSSGPSYDLTKPDAALPDTSLPEVVK